MKLILTLESHDPQVRPGETTMVLDRHGLTIGRGPMNDWMLPDPNRYVSNYHCAIEFEDESYIVRDLSQNGVYLNASSEPIGRGNAEVLQDGDLLRFGIYEITAQLIDDRASDAFDESDPFVTHEPRSAPRPTRTAAEPFDIAGPPIADESEADDDPFRSPSRRSADPFDESRPFGPADQEGDVLGQVERDPLEEADPFGFGAEAAGNDPLAPPSRRDAPLIDDRFGPDDRPAGRGADFDIGDEPPRPVIPDDVDFLSDLAPEPAWRGPSEPDHVPPQHEYFAPPRAIRESGAPSLIPDDWDPLADLAPTPPAATPRAAPHAAPPRPPPGPVRDPARPVGPPPGPPRGAAPPPPPRTGPPVHRPAAPDWPAAEGEDEDRVAPRATHAVAAHAVAAQPGAAPPGAAPPGAAPPAGPPPVAARSGRQAADRAPRPDEVAALHAFLAGAGLDDLEVPETAVVPMLHAVGATYREMVHGMREVLSARTKTKQEFRLDQTRLQAAGNNPLKVMEDEDIKEILEALLLPRGSSYLPADRAVREGFRDIKAHQLAVMAGMRVALDALIKRFDPATLQQRLEQQSVLDSLVPATRKAKYWDLFTELYQEIAREAEDDFQSLFGRTFARAYQEQVRTMKS